MNLEEFAKNLEKQFLFEPKIENKDLLRKKEKLIFYGMGGSHLASDFLYFLKPNLDFFSIYDFNLPEREDIYERLNVFISFSGNTKETINCLNLALEKNLDCLVISQNGKIIEIAKEKQIPYIKIPEDKILPRFGIGYMLKSLFELVEFKEEINLNLDNLFIENAEELARMLIDKIPIIYTFNYLKPFAYYLKISFNENLKTPAFLNLFPEIFHNEIEMLENENLTKNFFFIIISSFKENELNNRQIEIFKRILKMKNLDYFEIKLNTENKINSIFNFLIFSYKLSLILSLHKKIDINQTNLINFYKEEF